MYSPIDSSDETILTKANTMSKSWVSGYIDGQHRHLIREIIKDRGIDFNIEKIPLNPPPNVLMSILKSNPRVHLYEDLIKPEEMWFRPLSNDLPHSLSFDYNYAPVEYSVRLIVDETITLIYESLIIDFKDDCNNLLGVELILHMLRKASTRNIRFIWFRVNLKESRTSEFGMIRYLLEHINMMPQIVKTLITGISEDELEPALKQIIPLKFHTNRNDLKNQLK